MASTFSRLLAAAASLSATELVRVMEEVVSSGGKGFISYCL